MQQESFVILQKMTQQQVELRKKELEQSSVQDQNPLKNVLESMKRHLELNQDLFLGNNVDHEKIVPSKRWKNTAVLITTAQQRLNRKIS